ncbi:MAG: caspase family protein, partial [Spirochaetota bacterium]
SSMPPEWKAHFADLDADGEPDGAGNYAEYLFMHDATPIDDDVVRSLGESVSDDELATLLASVPSLQQIVVIDACHSGGFIGTASSYDSVPRNFEGDGAGVSVADALSAMTLYLEYDPDSFADIPDRQAIVISAAGEQEFSYESAFYGNGIFTHHFLKTPDSADRNHDGYVTANEAYAYASAAIAQVENDHFSGEGKFLPRVSGGAVDFVLFETE